MTGYVAWLSLWLNEQRYCRWLGGLVVGAGVLQGVYGGGGASIGYRLGREYEERFTKPQELQRCDGRSLGTFLGTNARSQTQPHGVRRKRSRCFSQEKQPDRTRRNHTQKSGENSKTGGCERR